MLWKHFFMFSKVDHLTLFALAAEYSATVHAKFGDRLSSVARLTVPNGYIWRVDITKDEGKVWFDDGWQEFMEYHLICVGYSVVFQYEKISNF